MKKHNLFRRSILTTALMLGAGSSIASPTVAKAASAGSTGSNYVLYESNGGGWQKLSPTTFPTGSLYAPIAQVATIAGVYETSRHGSITVWTNGSVANGSTAPLTVRLTQCAASHCKSSVIAVLSPVEPGASWSQLDLHLGERLPANVTSYRVEYSYPDGTNAWYDFVQRVGSSG